MRHVFTKNWKWKKPFAYWWHLFTTITQSQIKETVTHTHICTYISCIYIYEYIIIYIYIWRASFSFCLPYSLTSLISMISFFPLAFSFSRVCIHTFVPVCICVYISLSVGLSVCLSVSACVKKERYYFLDLVQLAILLSQNILRIFSRFKHLTSLATGFLSLVLLM